MTLPTGNSTSTDRRRSCAFTLIELILVMAVMVIAIGVSAPTLSHFFRGRALTSEAQRFLSLTRYGQNRAVSESMPMVLWIDAKQGTYGLRAEGGYSANDAREVSYQIDKDLVMEVSGPPVIPGQISPASQKVRGETAIRFQPGGFLGDTSPDSVMFRQNDGDTLWVCQSENHLHYEVQSNIRNNARR